MNFVLIHVHVPKCAGNSLGKFLDDSFPGRHLSLYVNRTSYFYSSELLARTVLQDPDVMAISSHFIRLFPSVINNRVPLYFTFLRHPVSQFLSYLTYIKKTFHNITDPELLRSVPQETLEMNLREMAEWILTRDTVIPFNENYQVNFFAEHAWSDISGYRRNASEYAMSRWDPDQFARYRAIRLDLSRCILSNFFFVGLVEVIEQGISYLRDKCRPLGLTLSDKALVRENTSYELLGDVKWLHQGDRVGKLLFESVREDLELYRWAKERWTSQRYEQNGAAGPLAPAVKWDRQFVTGATKDDNRGRVYLVANGMKRPVSDASNLPALPGVSRQVHVIDEWELNEIPPGFPI